MGVLGIVGNTDNNAGYGRYETKRLWQWDVNIFPAFAGSTLETLLATLGVRESLIIGAKTVGRPSVTFNEMVIDHGNEQWKLAGKTNWASEAIEMVFNDVIPSGNSGAGDIDPTYSAAAIFYQWQNLMQDVTTGAAGLSEDYKANIVVTQYNPAGTIIERILYHGAWPNSVSGDGWDYTSEEGNTITASMTFDKFYRLEIGSGENTPPAEVVGVADELNGG